MEAEDIGFIQQLQSLIQRQGTSLPVAATQTICFTLLLLK